MKRLSTRTNNFGDTFIEKDGELVAIIIARSKGKMYDVCIQGEEQIEWVFRHERFSNCFVEVSKRFGITQ